MTQSHPQSWRRGVSSSRSLPQICAEVSAAPTFDYSNSQSRSIQNTPPSLQVLSEASENALAEFESTLQNFRGAGNIWKYIEAVERVTGVSGRFAYSFRTELHFADEDSPEEDQEFEEEFEEEESE